jgi:hypothetical protein
MEILYKGKKGHLLNTVEQFYIYINKKTKLPPKQHLQQQL